MLNKRALVRVGWTAAVILAGLTLACDEGPANGRTAGRPSLPVQTVVAQARELPRTVSAVGSLESPEMTTLASEIAGTIVSLAIPEGERVDAGHVVMRLDDAEARATVSVTRARLNNATSQRKRVEQLFGSGVASVQQRDDAVSAYEAASGAHREATTRLGKHVLRSPYPGSFGLRQVDVGDYVRAGDPVVEISATDALEIRFALPQRYIPDISTGQKVLGIAGRCGPRFEATLIAIDPRVDPRTRMVGIRAAVTEGASQLHPGMAVRLRLVTEVFADAVVVPQEAIVRQGTRHRVFLVSEDGTVQPHAVELGDYFVDGVHVLGGIEPGDVVVVAGQQKLRVGTAVRPIPFERVENPNVTVGRYGPIGCESE